MGPSAHSWCNRTDVLPSARIMIHQPLVELRDEQLTLRFKQKKFSYHKRRLNELLAHHTGKPLGELKLILNGTFHVGS